LNFTDIFLQEAQISNFVKFRPVGAEFHAKSCGQSDRQAGILDEANSNFSQFFERP